MKTKHRFLTTFCILLFAFCIFCTFGAVSASAAEGTTIDLSTLTQNLNFYDNKTYSLDGGTTKQSYEGSITLTGSTGYSVLFNGGTHDVIFNNVSIETKKTKVVHLEREAALNLTLKGDNLLKNTGGNNSTGWPGLSLSHESTLTVIKESTGKLTAIGGYGAAGIGGDNYITKSYINILGGTVVATGGDCGAGIGSGASAEWNGTITISDANVTAKSGEYSSAAGIGSGFYGYDSNFKISIKNSTVVASGEGAGIGCGLAQTGYVQKVSISIEDSTVLATGGGGAGIGTAKNCKFTDITIKNSTVTASTDNADAAGIGSRGNGASSTDDGTITIENSTVTAVGGRWAAGIGGGYEVSYGPIVIDGSNINASGFRPIGAGDDSTDDTAPKNTAGNVLTLTTVTLDNVTNDIPVTKVEGVTGYDTVDLKTIGGKIYLYLPAGDSPTKIIANGNEYVGTVTDGAGTFTFEHICEIGAKGTAANCNYAAICGTCLQYFGEKNTENHNVDNANWIQENDKHYHACLNGCGTYFDEAACSGGEATCTEKAVCEACGESYGDEVGGHSITAEGDKAANCGSKAYCSVCDSEYGEVDKTNHDFSVEYENGFCENGCYEPASDSDADGVYEISNAGQLFWFANHVNTMDRTASAVLVADIDLENRPWTPIGETGENNKNFRGVFDGRDHTIKGLYVEGSENGVGFFGEVRTGTVKNFTIYGEVVVDTEVSYVGGVIGSICGLNSTDHGLERNGAIIQNITSYVNLTAKAHGVGMIGGFVGYANHQSLIENCSWYGTFDAGIYRVDSGAGGFIGKIQENTSEVTIRNCAAYGTIKTNYEKNSFNNNATIYMGGFLSLSDTGAGTVLENCLFAGKFERGENLTDEAFLGAFGTLRSVNSIKNCYYLGDGVLEAVHSNSNLKPGSDNVEITSVTKAQLLSGEVAYKIGEHFGQILEGENRQSYPVLGGRKVEDSQRFEIYGQQLNIGGDLSMKYYVMGYAPEFNSGALYMEFSHNGVKTKVYAGEPNADGFYVFVLEGINPQCMGDSIRAMLYYNETEVTSHGCEDGKEYSVEKNLLNLLEKYKDDAALVTLIKDTLAYGEAASAYKKHQTMTGNTYTENSSNREIPVSEAQVADVITGYTVRFGTAISIIIEVNPSAFEDTIYKVECNGTELRNFPSPNSPLYKVTNIAATDFDKEWEFVVRSTNPMGDVYGTVVVSVNDYLYAISQSSTDEKMVNLAKALYNYGVSANEYAASQSTTS